MPLQDFISIHALLAESDGYLRSSQRHHTHFYPRSPCGERLFVCRILAIWKLYFYPRSPCGERLLYCKEYTLSITFLSTLSLRRATLKIRGSVRPDEEFLSTLSLRRATISGATGRTFLAFLSTLSLRRATGLMQDRPKEK